VREQRIRGIHAASGSTAKLPKTNLDGLSVATLKLICADRKLPTSGEDKDGKLYRRNPKMYIDRILAGLPGKKPSRQLENRNVDDHAASADFKAEGGGGGGQVEVSRPYKTEALKDAKESAHVLSNYADAAVLRSLPSGDEHKRKRDSSNNLDQQQVVRDSLFRHTFVQIHTFIVMIQRYQTSLQRRALSYTLSLSQKKAEGSQGCRREVRSVYESCRSGSSPQCRKRSCWRRNGF
jgi:hypothetical protein